MKDAIGDRMKSQYEYRSRYKLPRRSYTIIRVDGKAFSSYTRGLDKPFDDALIADMDATAAYLCKNMMGAKLAFVQSDEISIILTDFDTLQTQAWFDNNIQKMCSVSASMATSEFNYQRFVRYCVGSGGNIDLDKFRRAEFDARVFQIPEKEEVLNYLIWRQQDTVRNSIASVAQTMYSQKELEGKNSNDQQEMIFQKGTNWNDLPVRYKRGRLILKEEYEVEDTTRTRWVSTDPETFTQNRELLYTLIP
jgi:tRNA(His) guanylyltransferase